MSFTGDVIDAATAQQWGLVSQVVSADALLPAANKMAERIAANPTHAVRLTKRLMREALHSRLDTILELSAVFQAMSHQTADHREAVDAFLTKRKPVFG
jgi:enoyl-CoA hydratase/carnithine racemase